MDNILEGLNEEQVQAVTSIDGHVRVIAGAGSGKTKALVHRYAYLVNECGVAPGNILSVTFTNKAAQEMKSRIRQMIGDNDIGYICTFHGLCVRILREDIHYLNYPRNFAIIDQDDQKTLLADVYEELGISEFTHPYSDTLMKIAQVKTRKNIQYVKAITKAAYHKENKTTDIFTNIFNGYLNLQRKNYALDFTDLMEFTFALFVLRPDVLEKWQKRFQYIQVDEFQDVSDKENKLVSALAAYHNNLFIVGDPDQTIYTWRGADVSYIIDFTSKYEDAKSIVMNKNYRSSKTILDCSNSMIKHNKTRVDKDVVIGTERQNTGVLNTHYHGKTQIDECEWIAKEIKKITKSLKNDEKIAILYRSRYAVPGLEIALGKENVKYRIRDGISFYNRSEIKTIIAYFTFIVNQDNISFKKIINVPKREFGKPKMKKLEQLAEEYGKSLYETLMLNDEENIFDSDSINKFLEDIGKWVINYKSMKVSELLDEVLKVTGFEKNMMTNNDDEDYNSIVELKKQIYDAETNYGEKMTLQMYLDDVALATSMDVSDSNIPVNLMTIHSAKGLEFDYVFVCELNESVFPSSKIKTQEQMEEERRIAYVAMTRAKKKLYLTDAESFSEKNQGSRRTSRFIRNCAKSTIDQLGEYSEEYNKQEEAQEIFDNENALARIKAFHIGDIISYESFNSLKIVDIDLDKDAYIVELLDKTIKHIDRCAMAKYAVLETCEEKQTSQKRVLEKGDIIEHSVFGRGQIIDLGSNGAVVKFDKYKTERTIANIEKLVRAENAEEVKVESSQNEHTVGAKVFHRVYGFGVIQACDDNGITINFVSGSTKVISSTKLLEDVSDGIYEMAQNKTKIKCKTCGYQFEFGNEFCPECGETIGW